MEKLTAWVTLLMQRWTAKSPRAYAILTDVFTIIGIIATIVAMLPSLFPKIILPPWAIALTAFVIAIASKLTVAKPPPDA